MRILHRADRASPTQHLRARTLTLFFTAVVRGVCSAPFLFRCRSRYVGMNSACSSLQPAKTRRRRRWNPSELQKSSAHIWDGCAGECRAKSFSLILKLFFIEKGRCASVVFFLVAGNMQHPVANVSLQQVPRLSLKCAPEISERLLLILRRSHAAIEWSFSCGLMLLRTLFASRCFSHVECSAIT